MELLAPIMMFHLAAIYEAGYLDIVADARTTDDMKEEVMANSALIWFATHRN
jgi:hypothetical protein